MNFIAIDFETANEQRNSACEIGICVVKDSQIVESKAWLIRPPELRFNSFNTYLHGISAKNVQHEPAFDALWPQLRPYLENQLVLAHNASFDLSVLRSLMDYYHITYPELTYSCSLSIAKKVWLGQPSYRLNALAEMLAISLDHHQALSDAIACARITLLACQKREVQSIEDMEKKLSVKAGRLFCGGYAPCTSIRKRMPLLGKQL
ncbi:MAG: 3'-5' exonuclease [Bacteroidota bacterium]